MDIGKFIAECYELGIRLLNKKPKETLTKEKEQCDEVHHKIPLTPENIYNPEITLNWDNLELLCSSCHSIEHNKKYEAIREDVMFDENGDLVKRE